MQRTCVLSQSPSSFMSLQNLDTINATDVERPRHTPNFSIMSVWNSTDSFVDFQRYLV